MSRSGSANPISFLKALVNPNPTVQQQSPGNTVQVQPETSQQSRNRGSNYDIPPLWNVKQTPNSIEVSITQTHGRVNKAPPSGFAAAENVVKPPPAPAVPSLPSPPTPPPQQQSPPQSKQVAAAVTKTGAGEKEKEKDDDTTTSSNSNDADEISGETDDKTKPRLRRKRKITLVQKQVNTGTIRAVCCCDLQSGVVSIGFINVVIGFIAAAICGMNLSAHKHDVCHQVGLGLGLLFIIISIFLIAGGLNRSSVLCLIYLVFSWLTIIAATLVIFILDDCKRSRGVFLYIALACAYLFKIYEAVVVYYFLKEPTPSPEDTLHLSYGYTPLGYPMFYSDPAPVFVPYGGYGLGFRPHYSPYGYGPYGYGYGYDPALGMMTGLGLGMALSGGWGGYDNCCYDSCYW